MSDADDAMSDAANGAANGTDRDAAEAAAGDVTRRCTHLLDVAAAHSATVAVHAGATFAQESAVVSFAGTS